MTETDLYLLKVDAVAGEGCKYEMGREMRLLVMCKAASRSAAAETALTPLALAGWTRPKMIDVAPMAPDPATIAGVPGQATRHALANGYAIVAYP
ncbi:MAG: hypothetical protein ACREEB_12305 [Caulobacteraceae bacterium]